jgi:catechol 2,3-dioxygenase-like lactoylglutathione lyase family enzyme
MPTYLSHLFLETTNLTQTRHFWTHALGLTLLEDRGPYIKIGDPHAHGFTIGIEQHPDPDAARDRIANARGELPEITIHVDNVDATAAHLQTLGIPIEDGPADQPWGARHAWLRDPDGRRISIYSETEPH